MSVSYRINDPLPGVSFPFGFGANGVPVFECLRLLCGSADLERVSDGKCFRLRSPYLLRQRLRLGAGAIDRIVEAVFGDDLTTEAFEGFLRRARGDNRLFWDSLNAELCLCLASTSEGRHLNAFLHLYRLFELISVAVPLLYISHDGDYRRSYEFIKSINDKSDNDSGALILKIAVERLAVSAGYENLSIEFDLSSNIVEWNIEFIEQLNRVVVSKMKNIDQIDSGSNSFELEFSNIGSFFYCIRNRMFHNQSTKENFNLDRLGGAEKVCQVLVAPTLRWIGLVIVEIVKIHARRYI